MISTKVKYPVNRETGLSAAFDHSLHCLSFIQRFKTLQQFVKWNWANARSMVRFLMFQNIYALMLSPFKTCSWYPAIYHTLVLVPQSNLNTTILQAENQHTKTVPGHSIFFKIASVQNEDSGKPALPCSLIKGSKGSAGGQQIFWSVCAYTQTYLCLCWAQIYSCTENWTP